MAPRRPAAASPASGPTLPPSPGVAGLRRDVIGALGEGIEARALLLRLSRRDMALLKRSPDVAVEEIRFADNAMHFLGVRVAAEAVDVSHLDRSPSAAETP